MMKAITDFQKRKAAGQTITMVTCYDASTARILATTSVDAILVGDSCAMVVHGHPTTIHATVEMMAAHTAATRRGAPQSVLITDLPFLSYRRGLGPAMDAVSTLVRAGANAVKLEGSRGSHELIRHLVDSGIPVMGHLGLMPQSVNATGGYRMQAKSKEAADVLVAEAADLEKAGCFSLVLECIPAHVAAAVTKSLKIPTIGIGCGPHVSGQVLVVNDLMGMDAEFKPRFARSYGNGHQWIAEAIERYCSDVRNGAFPSKEEYTE